MEKTRPPLELYILTIITVVLAFWMVFFGLQLRFFGDFVSFDGVLSALTPPANYVRIFIQFVGGASAEDLGWPLVVIGCSLAGSLAGLWKQQHWSSPSLTFFSLVSLVSLHWISSFSLLILLLVRLPVIGGWLPPDDANQG